MPCYSRQGVGGVWQDLCLPVINVNTARASLLAPRNTSWHSVVYGVIYLVYYSMLSGLQLPEPWRRCSLGRDLWDVSINGALWPATGVMEGRSGQAGWLHPPRYPLTLRHYSRRTSAAWKPVFFKRSTLWRLFLFILPAGKKKYSLFFPYICKEKLLAQAFRCKIRQHGISTFLYVECRFKAKPLSWPISLVCPLDPRLTNK